TRLRPYTDNTPKPLVPVNGMPILDYTMAKLRQSGIGHVTINLNYLGDRIENYFKDCKDPKITFSKETELLDTGGGVKYALHTMENKPFFLINGDALWTDGDAPALDRLADYWNPDIMDILLLLQPVENMTLTHGVGDYDLNKDGKAVRTPHKTGAYMFGGIRIVKPEVFEGTADGAFSFLDLMDKAQASGRLYGLIHDGEWHHISTPEELERVNTAMNGQGTAKTA
ncbi:MAG TPA: nucleotidyltransferase family protein, partial [Alphaproteobacteria bacterium]|nr:nucleotidyltransferase family protein [Alphaproteobacteria bacterium]